VAWSLRQRRSMDESQNVSGTWRRTPDVPVHSRVPTLVGPLRTLMTGYQLWGSRNECDARELSSMFRISATELFDSLRYLAHDGLVLIDYEKGTVSLTAAGARALALLPSATDS